MTNLEHIEIFPWNKSLETGIEEIDEQHKVIVNLINTIASNGTINTPSNIFEESVDELLKYTQYHFKTEEAIWEQYYPPESALKSHIKTHDNFIRSVTRLALKFPLQSQQQSIEDLLTLLTHWLTQHILDSDMRMSLTIQGIDSGLSLENAEKQSDKKMTDVMSVIIETSLFMYDNLCNRTLELNREINAHRKAEKNLYDEARKYQLLAQQSASQFYDNLTGFTNKELFKELSVAFINVARINNHNETIIYLHIGGLSGVVKSHGANAGDELLLQVTQLLKGCVQETDIIARIAHSTFAILLTNQRSKSEAESISANIRDILSNPLSVADNDVTIDTKIDIFLYPKDGDFLADFDKRTNRTHPIKKPAIEFEAIIPDESITIQIKDKLNKLTKREEEVLQQVIKGKTNKEIARILDISIKTVEFHRSRMMTKMEVDTLADLVKITVAEYDS